MHHRRVKRTNWVERGKAKQYPSLLFLSQSRLVVVGGGGHFNGDRTVTVGTLALRKQTVHCNQPAMTGPRH